MDAVVERLDHDEESEDYDGQQESQVGPDLTSLIVPKDVDLETTGNSKESDNLRASLSYVVFGQTLTLTDIGDVSIDEKGLLDREFDNVIMAGDSPLANAKVYDKGDPPVQENAAVTQTCSPQDTGSGSAQEKPSSLAILQTADNQEQLVQLPTPVQKPTIGSSDSAADPTASADDFDDGVDPALLVSSLKAAQDSDDEFDFDLPEPKSKPASGKSVKFSGVHLADSGDGKEQQEPKKGVQEEEKSELSTVAVVAGGTSSTTQSDGSEILHSINAANNSDGKIPPPVTDDQNDQKDEDEEDRSHIITSSAADWDHVETVEAGFGDLQPGEEGESMALAPALLSFSEIWQHFRSVDHSSVKHKIQTSVERRGFYAFVRLLFGPPKLHRDLQAERELVFCVAATAMVNDDKYHTQALQTIYRILTGSRFNCQRYGLHWEEIGFQGRDPATDLRGTGMLALTQLIHFLQNPDTSQLARDIYKLSLHPTQNFPFCVMCINISRICLQTLREDILNKECNKQHAVVSVVNQFYSGALLHLYRLWKQGKTISDSGFVIKEVETRSKKSTKDVFRDLQEYIASQKPVIDGAGDGDANFFSVVRPEKTKSAAELY